MNAFGPSDLEGSFTSSPFLKENRLNQRNNGYVGFRSILNIYFSGQLTPDMGLLHPIEDVV